MKKENFKTIVYWKLEAVANNNCKIFHCFGTRKETRMFLLKHYKDIKKYNVKLITKTIINLDWKYDKSNT